MDEDDFSGFQFAEVARTVERRIEASRVVGSTPTLGTIFTPIV